MIKETYIESDLQLQLETLTSSKTELLQDASKIRSQILLENEKLFKIQKEMGKRQKQK